MKQESPPIRLNGIVVIVGSYGSGKTEVAINLAMDQQGKGRRVRVADLDLVNPYFRTREARKLLTASGVEVILPPEGLLQADLPILAPEVAGLIRHPGDLAILDVGGDSAGATVLASLADAFDFQKQSMSMLQIVNPLRPQSDTVEGCLAMRRTIEAASRLRVSAWCCNANLMGETTPEHIYQGHELVQRLAKAGGLPVAFVSIAEALLPQVDLSEFNCPVLPIHRQLVPPWEKAVAIRSHMI